MLRNYLKIFKKRLPVGISAIPRLTPTIVKNIIKKTKIPNSQVPGDIPKKFVKDFVGELAVPLTMIYTKSVITAEWPKMWKTEWGTPL